MKRSSLIVQVEGAMPLKRIEDLTRKQRAVAEAILARNRTPE